MTLRIGIDVGGTNTDAVVLEGNRVVASCKAATTSDILSGVVAALASVTETTPSADVSSVVVGTTHFVNAITEARNLSPVVAIRLATPPQSLPPFTDWPDRLVASSRADAHAVLGGHQFDGSPLNAADLDQVRSIVRSAPADQLDFVVSGVFSPVNPDGEKEAAEAILSVRPDARITLSHDLGRVGILERENAAILNAALRPLAEQVVSSFDDALRSAGLDAPLLLSQNDGTVMDLDTARRRPIVTVASGPTNSMRGAAIESGEADCVVIDVGGTTTDIGLLQAGFPRQSSRAVSIGGVRTNFRMPDVVSIGIGGGSHIGLDGPEPTIGPQSVGYELTSQALVFGGSQLTFTDIAVAAGRADIGDPSLVADLDAGMVADVLAVASTRIADKVDEVKLEAGGIAAVAVGGGAALLEPAIEGTSRVVIPDNAGVANAIGAALANIGCEIDRIYPLADSSREQAIAEARNEAIERAVASGADPATIEVVDQEDIPLTHLPEGTATRIRVRVIGDRTTDAHAASPTKET